MIPGAARIFRTFGVSVMKPEATRFFSEVVRSTLSHRVRTKTRRNDLIDLMADAIRKELKPDDAESNPEELESDDVKLDNLGVSSKNSKESFSVDDPAIIGTAMVMLIAGYDTTSNLMTFAAYELAKHPDVQSRLQEEIDEAYDACGGDAFLPEYAVVQDMKYLDMIIQEILRLHPPAGYLQR